jgi:hypothetical protein
MQHHRLFGAERQSEWLFAERLGVVAETFRQRIYLENAGACLIITAKTASIQLIGSRHDYQKRA